AYVPLDPSYPAERLAYMIRDAGIELLLTDAGLTEKLPAGGLRLVYIESAAPLSGVPEEENPGVEVDPDSAAYVIYTSGSTGNPKGVLIQHRSLSNYTQAAAESFGLKPEDRALQFSSISFDAAAEEIYPCLITGATLVVRDERMLDTTETFVEKILEYGVTVLDMPTAYWHHLTNDLAAKGLALPKGVRFLTFGGEEALAERLAQWRSLACEHVLLLNSYGPTETTIVATACDLTTPSEAGVVPPKAYIGSPVANVRTYVLDARLQPVPVGVAGELYIGGAGVARGYVNRPALTAERFIPDPYSPEPGGRLYRTGDVARYLADGTLDYVGRADNQVKVRGYRIELGEVESALASHPEVGEAAVVAREDAAGGKRLVAYVVAKHGREVAAGPLREHLRASLPEYMVPSAFVVLDTLPLTPNGKVDRRALPEPGHSAAASAESYEPPRTPVEEVLCGIWAEVLGVERVGVEDDFFELGGHSLLATQVVSRLREALRVEVPLRALFESPRVSRLAPRVEELARAGMPGTTPPPLTRSVGAGEAAPLSFAQQRLWFLDQLEPHSAAYNIPAAVRLRGRLD
ncbi:MAG: amino acid adenylation domain-containing protein, partial [Acidobacteria bacterium]|nr:amino acid adenylation domain-containing protein [Acidobacteriota bacterium]